VSAGYPIFADEDERIAALRALALLDTPSEERFDRITRTAQRLFDVPIALVTLVDTDRQWFKSCQGLDVLETPRSASFCTHALRSDDILIVPDAHTDPRFAGGPLVLGSPHIRFYAGKPIHAPSGHRMGTLCIIDSVPRELSEEDAAALTDLAAWAELELGVVAMSRAFDAAERLKDEIISITGHELRTPLTAIRGSLGLLEAGVGGELPEQGARLVDSALRNTDRLIRLVNDMLDVERLAAGRLPMRREPVELTTVAHTAAESLHDLVAAANVRLELTAPAPVWTVGDADRLTQVATNLIDNAVKFSPPEATVRVAVTARGGRAELLVTDEGYGMDTAGLDTVFDRFIQLDTGTDRRGAGSGLGLAIVKGIVEGHYGTIDVTSELGAGSSFRVRLPLTDAR
jgi:signal transduction histidine kinase